MWFYFWKMRKFLHLHSFWQVMLRANHHHWIIYFWAYLAVRNAYHLHIRFRILKSICRPDVFFRGDNLMLFCYSGVRLRKILELISAFFWVFLCHLEISEHKQKFAGTEKHRYVPALQEVSRHLENQFSQSPEQTWKRFIIFHIQNIWKSASLEKP